MFIPRGEGFQRPCGGHWRVCGSDRKETCDLGLRLGHHTVTFSSNIESREIEHVNNNYYYYINFHMTAEKFLVLLGKFWVLDFYRLYSSLLEEEDPGKMSKILSVTPEPHIWKASRRVNGVWYHKVKERLKRWKNTTVLI